MSSPLNVTDHAVLRWLERVEGVNVTAIRKRLERPARVAQAHGARSVRKDGVTFFLRYDDCGGASVVTCHSPEARKHLAEPRLPRLPSCEEDMGCEEEVNHDW